MTATLPARHETRTRRLQGPTLLAGGVLAASLLLHLRDPHQGGSYAYCPWLVLTGTYCPGCGGLRAVNDLTNGDLAAAASSNLLFIASLPVLVLWWAPPMGEPPTRPTYKVMLTWMAQPIEARPATVAAVTLAAAGTLAYAVLGSRR